MTFVWTAVPYRMEWRYGAGGAQGHRPRRRPRLPEPLPGLRGRRRGTCAIAAYDQEAMDDLLGVDGEDEFTVYLAPVGKRLER